ncbi:hypothetical protein BSKO_08678 [Bryopsis sp. KO-2023]|nr:hypothetical protein BSKO_08678 [Bryopsis sp. KO-2023]
MTGILARLKMVQGSFARTGFGLPGSWHSRGRLNKQHQRAVQNNSTHAQHRTESTTSSNPPWQVFETSLGFELKTGCKNFQGRTLAFSEYARKATISFDPPPSLQEDFRKLISDLEKYPGLEISNRQGVLQSGLALISRWAELEKHKIPVRKAQNPAKNVRIEAKVTDAVEIKREGISPGVQPGRGWSIAESSQENNVSSTEIEDTFNRFVAVKIEPEASTSQEDSTSPGESRKKRMKESTEEQRQIFTEVANKGEDPMKLQRVQLAEQRSFEWLEGRKDRLTASAFAAVLGLQDHFEHDKVQKLWEEKLGLREPFKGNEFTAWGSKMEPVALEDYKRFSGAKVEEHGLKLLGEDEAHQWLAASPDGIITPSESTPDLFGMGASMVGKGILEIKCPHGRNPFLVKPRKVLQEYYYPQVQGLMDVFDLEWCHLMCWTKSNGATIFWIPRNRKYWAKAYSLLAEFWWENVMPAKLQITVNHRSSEEPDLESIDIEQFRPELTDPRREEIKRETQQIVQGLKYVSRGVPEDREFS